MSKKTLISLLGALVVFLTGVFTNYSLPKVKGSTSENVLVVKVVDGDTIEIAGGQKIRMIGVDTPETVDPKRPDGCFGIQASDFTKNLLTDKSVRLEKDVSETDKYGRLLRYVYLDEVMINEVLVKDGYAQVSTYPPDVKYQQLFIKAQAEARNQKRGMWNECPVKETVKNNSGDEFDILINNADRIIRTFLK